MVKKAMNHSIIIVLVVTVVVAIALLSTMQGPSGAQRVTASIVTGEVARPIEREFTPEISVCVGCLFKDDEVNAVMSDDALIEIKFEPMDIDVAKSDLSFGAGCYAALVNLLPLSQEEDETILEQDTLIPACPSIVLLPRKTSIKIYEPSQLIIIERDDTKLFPTDVCFDFLKNQLTDENGRIRGCLEDAYECGNGRLTNFR